MQNYHYQMSQATVSDRKVLICDYVDHLLLNGLQGAGHQVVYAPEIQQDTVREVLPSMSGVVVNTRTPIDGDLMRSCPKLEFISRLGIGLDIFDLEAASEMNIRIMNTPGANANSVGEHMFGMLLCLMHNIAMADRSIRRGSWLREVHRGRELAGLTIGVIGYGNTGTAFASKFDNWQTEVLAYDKYRTQYDGTPRFVRVVDLEELLSLSDIISLHIPLTAETEYMVDRHFISRCKPGVVLLNGSRGKVVRTADLLEGLDSGHVSGACLDVLENEKLHTLNDLEKEHFDSLVTRDNVVLTPHIAGWSESSKRQIAQSSLDGILSLKA